MSRHIITAIFAVAVAAILMTGASAAGKGAPGQTPPADQTPPFVSGTLQVGSALTASPGTWDGKGLKYAYQWLRCDTGGASCSAVAAASTSTYSPSSNDVGTTLRVVVTASNRVGSAAATSSATGAIAAVPAAQPPPPPPPPPPAVSPSATSLPTITGTVQQGQTLTGSTGTWSGTTPITYAYQWQRCDSAGGACVPIASATSATYLLASADVASTVRLSVTGSNSAGSATASSVATAVVTAATSTPVSAPLWPWASPNYTLGYTTDPTSLPHWQAANSNSVSGFNASYIFTVNDGSGGSATRLKIAPTTASTTSGTASTLYSPMPDRRITAYGSNTTASAYTAQGDDTWYRWKIRFPNGVYVPRTGLWNVNVEWHESRYGSTLTSCPTFPSSYFGVQADGTTASPGTNPRLIFHFRAGAVNSTGTGIENDFVIPEKTSAGTVKPLQYDHWYDVVAHYKWEPDNTGAFEWYVDGALQYRNLAIKTMHVFCDGSSYPNTFGEYNYQRNDGAWPSGVDYKLMNIGKTATGVGFTP